MAAIPSIDEIQLRNAVLFTYRELKQAYRAQRVHASELLSEIKKRGFDIVKIELMIDQNIVDSLKAKYDDAYLKLDAYENKRPMKRLTIDQDVQ